MAADTLSPGQQAFIAEITKQVNQFVGSQLPGTFQMVSYPSGFNYGIQYNQPPVTNVISLQAFDSLVIVANNGMLTLGEAYFSTTYVRILNAVSYQYSTSDNKVVQDPNIQSQQIAVAMEAQNGGYVNQFTLNPVTYYSVVLSVMTNFGAQGQTAFTSANILAAAANLGNAGFAGLQAAISNSQQQLAPLNAILNAQNQADRELTAAKANAQNPGATNGGLQTATNPSSTYYVNYGPLPTNNQVLGGLGSRSQVSVKISASNFSSTSTNFSITGGTSFSIPILDFLDIGISGSASYDMSKYTQSSSTLDMTLTYPGVSVVQAAPTPLSTNFATGWYDQGLLQSIIKGSNDPSISGFKLPAGSQYDVNSTFGPGKTFSRLKTFVISQSPTITMTFAAGNSSAISTDFKQNSSVNVKLFGLFSIGSVSQSYNVKTVDTTSVAGKITVTLAPPDIAGTVPLNQQVCYVLGGVAEYPPNN